MNINHPYNYKNLILTYIQTQRNDHIHTDFLMYYTTLLTHLEQLFEVDLSSPPSSNALFFLFRATINSYINLRGPMDSFLEAGLLFKKIEEHETLGNDILAHIQKINELTKTNQETHLQLIYALFTCIYGNKTDIITSQDLLAKGFDDSTQPQLSDYYDYL